MKNLLSISLLFVLFISSCKKTETVTPPFDLSGTSWTGTSNVPGLSLSDKPFKLMFHDDGTLTGSFTNSGTDFALNGTWNLRPNATTVHIYFTLASVSGSYIGQATLTTNNTKLESGYANNATTPSANLVFTVTKS
ncbi:MAG: hypothetical protein U0T73_07930 [Chitinophagales bacterium]